MNAQAIARPANLVTPSSAGAATLGGLHRRLGVVLASAVALVVPLLVVPTESLAIAINVAQGKTAKQSSVGWGGAASRAVDGNTSGKYGDNSVTHTQSARGSWWEVDLGRAHRLSKIEIYNRTDDSGAGEPRRLSNFEVVTSENGARYSRVYHQPGAAGRLTEIPLTSLPTARYVRVRLLGVNHLSLAEVKVFAASASSAASEVAPRRAAGPSGRAAGLAAGSNPALKPGVARNVQGFLSFLNALRELASSIKQTTRAAAEGIDGGPSALVGVALDGLLLKGIPDPDVRKILSGAIKAVVSRLSKKGFSLVEGVVAVLQSLAQDPALGNLLVRAIRIPQLETVIRSTLESILRRLANEAGVRSLMQNPLGFLADLGLKLIDDVKEPVADVLTGLVKPAPEDRDEVKADLVSAIDALKAAIQKRGFAELLTFGKVIGKMLVQGLYSAFVKLLRTNLPAAKAKLQELAAKLPFPAVASLAKSAIDALNVGATKLVDEAKLCRRMITGVDAESAKAVFECLKVAARAGVNAAGGGTEEAKEGETEGGEPRAEAPASPESSEPPAETPTDGAEDAAAGEGGEETESSEAPSDAKPEVSTEAPTEGQPEAASENPEGGSTTAPDTASDAEESAASEE